MLQVLLKSEVDRKVVGVKVSCQQTAAVLKACVIEAERLDPSTATSPVILAGNEVPDTEQISSLGLVNSTASIQGASSRLFPNSWWDSPFSKAFVKTQDITWPPLRQADFLVSLGWVLLLFVLLLATHRP